MLVAAHAAPARKNEMYCRALWLPGREAYSLPTILTHNKPFGFIRNQVQLQHRTSTSICKYTCKYSVSQCHSKKRDCCSNIEQPNFVWNKRVQTKFGASNIEKLTSESEYRTVDFRIGIGIQNIKQHMKPITIQFNFS